MASSPLAARTGHATFGEATELALRADARGSSTRTTNPDRDDKAIQDAVDGEARAGPRPQVEPLGRHGARGIELTL